MAEAGAVLEVDDLRVHFPVRSGPIGRPTGVVKAVDGVSFTLRRGETLSLVGESGCGKSTTALAILRLLPVTSGRILFDGEDLASLPAPAMRKVRRRLQMVFQDPVGSLNPRMSVADIIAEPLRVQGLAGPREKLDSRVADLLRLVGLTPDMKDRFPHQFSGGQRQRIGIARALALDPEVIVCDEPVSALDVSIQAQILNLLVDLQDRLGLAYLFISHDLSVVRHISHRVAVMYLGRIVESAPASELFAAPRHPYTEALIRAAPTPDPDAARTEAAPVRGEAPSPLNPPSGCPFHPRCPKVLETCPVHRPDLETLAGEPARQAACHLYPAAPRG